MKRNSNPLPPSRAIALSGRHSSHLTFAKSMKPAALFLSLLMIGCGQVQDKTANNDSATEKTKLAEESAANARQHEAEMDVTTVEDTPVTFTVWLSTSTVGATKGFTNGERAEVTPVFLRHVEGNDVYRIECRYPLDSDLPSKTIKEILFNGTEPVTTSFPKENLIVTVRPKQESEQEM